MRVSTPIVAKEAENMHNNVLNLATEILPIRTSVWMFMRGYAPAHVLVHPCDIACNMLDSLMNAVAKR
jgi:hypothetical protein